MDAPGMAKAYSDIINQCKEESSTIFIEDEKLSVDYNIELPVIKLNGKEVMITSTPKHKSFFKIG